jgi:hypothetical protein
VPRFQGLVALPCREVGVDARWLTTVEMGL